MAFCALEPQKANYNSHILFYRPGVNRLLLDVTNQSVVNEVKMNRVYIYYLEHYRNEA